MEDNILPIVAIILSILAIGCAGLVYSEMPEEQSLISVNNAISSLQTDVALLETNVKLIKDNLVTETDLVNGLNRVQSSINNFDNDKIEDLEDDIRDIEDLEDDIRDIEDIVDDLLDCIEDNSGVTAVRECLEDRDIL